MGNAINHVVPSETLAIGMSNPRQWQRAAAAAFLFISTTLAAVAAQVSPPDTTSAENSAHREIALDASLLDHYVGAYKLNESAVLTVSRHDSQLIAQLTGQAPIPIFPQSITEFFYKVVDAQISFVTDSRGDTISLILHQNGRNMRMVRIDTAVARQIAANLSAKIQSQTPAAGSEAALKRLIEGIGAGTPYYGEMTPELADATRRQLTNLHEAVSALGAVESVEFRGIGNQGWSIYYVKHERGSMQWRISLASDGKIAGALASAGP
jgi:hypothetical protein